MIVKVYWNLHKNCWSVLHNGKIYCYASSVYLKNVSFVVSESGRQRVIKEKRKNVHAFAKGTLISVNKRKPNHFGVVNSFVVSYNPYKFGWFYKTQDLSEITNCSGVWCGTKTLVAKE